VLLLLVLLFNALPPGICEHLQVERLFKPTNGKSRAALYIGRLVAGFGVGAASMLTPLYASYGLVFWSQTHLTMGCNRLAKMLQELSEEVSLDYINFSLQLV